MSILGRLKGGGGGQGHILKMPTVNKDFYLDGIFTWSGCGFRRSSQEN